MRVLVVLNIIEEILGGASKPQGREALRAPLREPDPSHHHPAISVLLSSASAQAELAKPAMAEDELACC